VEVRVHNAGAVPAAVRERFFDKYSTAGKSGGSGLGTYSARLMARTQQGDIEMQSSEARGTTLVVRLQAAAAPEVPAAPAAAAAAYAAKAAAPSAPREGGPRSALVVDDDEYSRVFVQRFLAAARSATAANGREALEAVRADPPDVVVMDLDMPVMGGLEAAARIRAWEKETGRSRCAMIAMSSHDDPAIATRCLQAGFDHFVPKPVSPEAIRRAVAALTGGDAGIPAAPMAEAPADPGAPVRLQAKLKDALPGFLSSRRELIGDLERAIGAGETEAARALAHKLAGSFALYGFHWAAGQGKMIEKRAAAAAGGGTLEGLAAQAAALRRHLETVRVEIAE
jgi:CheY-like chemotaxis protein